VHEWPKVCVAGVDTVSVWWLKGQLLEQRHGRVQDNNVMIGKACVPAFFQNNCPQPAINEAKALAKALIGHNLYCTCIAKGSQGRVAQERRAASVLGIIICYE
jgi:hypothetical protein